MSRLYHVFSALLMLTSSAVLAEESGLPLAVNAASQFTIVRPADASPSQVYAAEEMQRFTKEMTGAQLPIIADDQPLPAKAILLGVTRHTDYLAKLRKQLEDCPPISQSPTVGQRHADRLVIEDRMISLGRQGEWGERVPDDEAEDGFAIKLFNTHYEWCLQWHVNPTVFEPDARYKLRVRVRVAKSDREGNAFWAGVYDMARKKGWGQIQPSTAEVQEGYQWYDVATWAPEADQYLWVGPGPFKKDGGQSAIEAVYVDRFELSRVE